MTNEDMASQSSGANVLSFFVRPEQRRRDQQWSDKEKQHVVQVFTHVGNLFFVTASRRQCRIFAVVLRDLALQYPAEARFYTKWAARVEEFAEDPDRVPVRASELPYSYHG